MIKYICALAVLTTGMAFAKSDPPTVDINKEVRHELVMLPYLDVFDNLAYRVDQIEVLPLSGHDNHLRLSLYRAIYGYPSLNRYALPVIKPIRIIVKNGHVTLEGVVDREADKNVANIRANGVHGVFSVTNNLRVAE